jgi:uncharacterized delta-60 repeat protein
VAAALLSDTPGSQPALLLARFDAAGHVMTSFGDDGVLRLLDSSAGGGIVLADASDTLTVLATNGNGNWKVARLTAGGELVTSFGDGGWRSYRDDLGGPPSAAVWLPGGGILFGSNGRVARLTPSGGLDDSWGDGGIVETGHGITRSLTLQPDGKVVLAAGSGDGYGVARLLESGAPDPLFGDGGFVPLEGEAKDVAVRSDGRLVVAGSGAEPGIGSGPALVGLTEDGAVDQAFGGDGKIVTPAGAGGRWLHVKLMPGGKVLTEGEYDTYTSDHHIFARYDAGTPTGPDEGGGGDDDGAHAGPSGGGGDAGGVSSGGDDGSGSPSGGGTAGTGGPIGNVPAAFPARGTLVTVAGRIGRRALRFRGLRVTLKADRSATYVVRLRAGGRTLASARVLLWPSAIRVLRLRVHRRRLPPALVLSVDADGSRVATRAIAVR